MTDFPSFRLRLALLAYSALWVTCLPFVLIYLFVRGRRDPDYAAHIAERFGWHAPPMPGTVWIHAVSLGELRSAVPLIRGLLAQGERVVITHFTPAGRRESRRVFAPELAAGTVRAVWIPFEITLCFDGFFRTFAPKYGLVMEIEVWPRMIMAARSRNIPLFMCNAQYPSKSYARDGQTGLRAELMRGFAGALVKSDLQAKRFASVGVQNIAVAGELRFDQPIPRDQVDAGKAVKPGRDVIAIASAVQGEDAVYISAINALFDDSKARCVARPLVLYIPRKPERFDEVATLLVAAGFSLARRSDLFGPDLALTGPLPLVDIVLGDSLGEMYFYLSMATRVVVGGGFTPKGAHNISEALALGKPVIVGPQTWTIEYPFEEAKAAGVVRSATDSELLAQALIAPQDATREQIAEFMSAHSGATARTLAAIPQLLAATNR